MAPSKPTSPPRAGFALRLTPTHVAILVFVVAFATYANTILHEFVWDDRNLIVENPAIKTLDTSIVARMFAGEFWESSMGSSYYRPLTTLSFHIDYQLFGYDPAGYHFTNVLINALVCVLVFLFVSTLFRHTTLGFVTALLFSLHPLHTESVAWVSGRTDILATFWSLVSLLLYVRGRRARDRARGVAHAAGTIVALSLALLCKESAAFIPAIMVVLELPPCRRYTTGDDTTGAARLAHTIPFFLVLTIYVIARARALASMTDYPAFASGIIRALGLPLSIIGGYAARLVMPLQLNAEYDAPVPISLADWHVVAGLTVLIGITLLVVRYRKRAEIVLGAAILLVGLTPVLNVIPLAEVSAERFLYLPSLGFVLMIAGIVTGALAPRKNRGVWLPPRVPSRTAVLVAFAVIACAFGVRTVTRTMEWRDEMTFFAATIVAAPNSARAHLNVGLALKESGQLDDAGAAFRRAIEISPYYADALSNLAGIYGTQGNISAALPLIERAIQSEPDNERIRINLGALYMLSNRFDDATREFQRVLATNPDNRTARYSLGCAYFYAGRHEAARPVLAETADHEEPYVLCYYYLAVIEATAGESAKARQLAQEFLRYYRRNDSVRADAARLAAPAPDGER